MFLIKNSRRYFFFQNIYFIMAVFFGNDAETRFFNELKETKDKEKALKNIKNLIIGSHTAKNHFIDLGLLVLYVKSKVFLKRFISHLSIIDLRNYYLKRTKMMRFLV